MEPKQNLDLNPFLEEERIRKIQEKLFDYSRKFGGRFPEDDEAHARYLIKKYSVNTSVLMGVLEDQVVEKRIVEVGPGYAGRFMLDFLIEQGADAISTDSRCNYEDYLGPSHGRYVFSGMEKLSEAFGWGVYLFLEIGKYILNFTFV